jgi:hypothetical protein
MSGQSSKQSPSWGRSGALPPLTPNPSIERASPSAHRVLGAAAHIRR